MSTPVMTSITMSVPEGTEIIARNPLTLALAAVEGIQPVFFVAQETLPDAPPLEEWVRSGIGRLQRDHGAALLADDPATFCARPARRTIVRYDIDRISVMAAHWWALGDGVGLLSWGVFPSHLFGEVAGTFAGLAARVEVPA